MEFGAARAARRLALAAAMRVRMDVACLMPRPWPRNMSLALWKGVALSSSAATRERFVAEVKRCEDTGQCMWGGVASAPALRMQIVRRLSQLLCVGESRIPTPGTPGSRFADGWLLLRRCRWKRSRVWSGLSALTLVSTQCRHALAKRCLLASSFAKWISISATWPSLHALVGRATAALPLVLGSASHVLARTSFQGDVNGRAPGGPSSGSL